MKGITPVATLTAPIVAVVLVLGYVIALWAQANFPQPTTPSFSLIPLLEIVGAATIIIVMIWFFVPAGSNFAAFWERVESEK